MTVNQNIKDYYMAQYKKVQLFKKNDVKYKEYHDEIENIRDQMKKTFAQIQSLDETIEDEEARSEMLTQLDQNMDQLVELVKLTEEDRDNYAMQKFSDLKQKNAGLLKLFIEKDLDPNALNHCLNTFVMMQQGLVNQEQAKQMGWTRFNMH